MLTRRAFTGQLLAAAAGGSEPLLDLHQHVLNPERPEADLLNHSRALGATKTVLLPAEGWMRTAQRDGGNDVCSKAAKAHPGEFLLFTNADPQERNATATLGAFLKNGAIGIGEMKYQVACNGPEMRAVYDVAAGFQVPVLLHFQDGQYNDGFANFSRILEMYPKVNFLGHANTWWAHVSAEVDPKVGYPTGPVRKGGLTDRLLSDYANVYGDLSANSGLNALRRDPEFARGFLDRHQDKLFWGTDCLCRDGRGGGRDYCIGRECLNTLRELAGDRVFRKIVWENGTKLLKI